ncbi:MAG TPA: DUF1559 domain-containing protein [Gemmataceae bacterium]|nr:DUF1559 domain-containing protein [Gemmataceae bacterium]
MAMTTFARWRGGGMAALLLGALLVAVLTTENYLPADAEEKPAVLPADLAKIPTDGTLIVSGRVADLWGSELLKPALQKYKEISERPIKEFQERFSLSLDQIERMTLLLLSPPPSEEPLLFVRTVKPYDLAKVIAAVKSVKAKKYKNETLYVGDKDWTIYPLDDRSLVYGELREVHAVIDHPKPKTEGNLAAALRLAAGKHSMVLGVNFKLFYDTLGSRLPGEVEPFLPLLQSLSATLRVDFAADSRAAVVLAFATEKDAKAALKPAQTGLTLLRAGLDHLVTDLSKDKEAKDLFGLLQQLQGALKATSIEQKSAELRAAVEAKIDAATVSLTLVRAVQKMRESAARAQGANNLKQIGLAMQNYADVMQGRMPAHAIYSKDGKPLLSWRVLILPYIEQQELYSQFHLNEPWDSAHNKKLLAKMPKTYASPLDEKAFKEYRTYYQGFHGKGAFFEGKQGVRFPVSFTDGTSNTIMILEASKAVPWTKPEDIPFDPAKPLPKLGLPGVSYFLAGMCDGSVRTISHSITKETLRSAITRDAGDLPGPDF